VIALDASVLIAHLARDDAHHRQASELLTTLSADVLMASVITLAEVLAGPARHGRLDAIAGALEHLGVTAAPVDSGSSAALAELRASTRLKLPDCCVLLVAESRGGELATFDARLAAAARNRGLVVHTIAEEGV
jgi:predicted nucleic acid-binding protein